VVTCKIKHLQNICKNVLEPREVDGSKAFLQMFYVRLHVTTVCLQNVFDTAKLFCTIFLQMFSVKHLKNIIGGGYMKNKTLKHFCKGFGNVLFSIDS